DLVGHLRLELLEVLLEHAGELRGRRVVGATIGPGLTRVQHVRRHAWHLTRHRETEDRILGEPAAIERALEGRGDHGAGVLQLHTRAGSICATGPARIHEPDARATLAEPLTEHLGVYPR